MVTGAVLAGGRSIRFGKNKALEMLDGKRFIERAVESLRPFCDPVMVVVNEISPYMDLGFTLVQDVMPRQGPLGGIYTALMFSIDEWVFVKATDMPFCVSGLGSFMVGQREGYDIVVPRVGEYYEPLFALYNRRCAPHISRQLAKPGERKITEFFKHARVRSIREEEWRKVDPDGLSFKNVNTPEDLANLRWT